MDKVEEGSYYVNAMRCIVGTYPNGSPLKKSGLLGQELTANTTYTAMDTVQPTQIVILGGTGDLSRRKLLPALLDLYTRKMLPKTFQVIGLARSQFSNADYLDFVAESIQKHGSEHTHSRDTIDAFCKHIEYIDGDFNDPVTYESLHRALNAFDEHSGTNTNRLFYLAVPPSFYKQIFTDLSKHKLSVELPDRWTHILVEKPFGRDHQTAQVLDTQMASLFKEEQIFRIDHYLAKEAVQNILSFKFANSILKTAWNKDSIESVQITMSEEIIVGERAGFYEDVGALRDVGQNHLLQLLALVAMEEPTNFSVEAIREKRIKVLEALKPITEEKLEQRVLRAQYTDYICNELTPGDSKTETYFELIAELDLPDWKNVPFYIRAGKALNEAKVSIEINFKDVATGVFETGSCLSTGNQIKLIISPEQTMSIVLNAKSPGLGYQLETRELSFTCKKGDAEIKNSYEKVLFDSITGDQTLFTRTEEVLAAWNFITPIMIHWQKLPLHTYEKGSSGPTESIIPN